MSVPKTAFVLHSGGIDSTTCLALAVDVFGRGNVLSFSVDYGQRHSKEIDAARQIAIYYGIPHSSFTIPIPRTMLTDRSQAVPDISYADIKGISPTYVPFRNGLMLSALSAHAQSYSQERGKIITGDPNNGPEVVILFGAHAEDAEGWAYPDCTPEFIGAMANAIFVGTYQKVRLEAPLTYLRKHEIIKTGYELSAPYHLTWSCLAKGTKVRTLAGLEAIETIQPGRWIWGFDDIEQRWVPTLVENQWFQGIKEVYEITLHDGAGHYSTFEATADHLLALREGGYARVDEVTAGVRLMPARPYTVRVGKNKVPYLTIRPHNLWHEPPVYVHRYVANFFGISGEGVVHHGAGGSLNNDPSNLEGMTLGDHTRRHMAEASDRIWNDEVNARRAATVAQRWAELSNEERSARTAAIREGRNAQNHIITRIKKVGEKPTYDLQTSTRNFALGAGVFVHNCYKGEMLHCGTCPTCRARKEAFQSAGVSDPTQYTA